MASELRHVTSPAAALAARQDLETRLMKPLDTFVRRFLHDVMDDAADALDAPVLIAAARPTDRNVDVQVRAPSGQFVAEPFSYTQVMKRWRKGIEELSKSLDLDALGIRRIMEDSDLPMHLFDDVKNVLAQAPEAGWTKTGLKRKLSAELIPAPKPGAGQHADQGRYRNRVRNLARDAATQSFNRRQIQLAGDAGYTHKMWVSRRDGRVRDTHIDADGQVVPVDATFTVGGYSMQYPHDSAAPAGETAGCRCVTVATDNPTLVAGGGEIKMTENHTPDLGRWTQFAEATVTDDCGCEDTLSAETVTLAEDPPAADAPAPDATERRWEGVIGMEGVLTGDGRLLEKGAMRWEDLPIGFRYVAEDVGAHDGAVSVGKILTIERLDDGRLWATGTISGATEAGQEAIGKLERGDQDGVSMDLDEMSFEIRVAAELLGMAEESPVEAVEEKPEQDEEGRVTVVKINPADEVMVATDGLIRTATMVAIPAFKQARIKLLPVEEDALVASPSLVASGTFESRPDPAAFMDPKLAGPTALVVTKEGRVYGHVATWDTCHISYSNAGMCVTPPKSASDYAYFHLSAVEASDDTVVPVGRLFVDTTHAGERLKAKKAFEHYEHTGATAAFVRAGQDAHGIWVAGVVNPDASEEQIRALRSAPLSGDWRKVNGRLELIAALSVNVAGFPIPRTAGLVASGRLESLVASGMVTPGRLTDWAPESGGLSEEDLSYVKALVRAGRAEERSRKLAALRSRVRAAEPGARVEERTSKAAALAERVAALKTKGRGED